METQSKKNRLPGDHPLRFRRRLFLFGLGVATYFLSFLLSRTPSLVESTYGSGLGPPAARGLSFLTGWAPFSIGELLLLAYLSFQLWAAWKALETVLRRKRSIGNALASGALRGLRDAGVLITLFYFLWGFNYSRPPLEETLGWELPDSVSMEEVTSLVEELIRAANDEYRIIHGTDDAGVPTELSGGRDSTVLALAEGWHTARRSLGFPERPEPQGKLKKPLLRPWYEWVGIAGFYFPFTGEPNVRGGIPAMDAGKIFAHELAHQRGVAREAEANFWAFLSAGLAWKAEARYSAYIFAQRQLMAQLRPEGRDREAFLAKIRSLVELRLPGVQRDIEASSEYWASHRGRGTRVGRAVNDTYLRTNRVVGGVRNYSRERGGRIVP